MYEKKCNNYSCCQWTCVQYGDDSDDIKISPLPAEITA